MTLRDIIARIDRSKLSPVYIETIAPKMGIIRDFQDDTDQSRLASHYFQHWICTDTLVGYQVYFFDGEPVAASVQVGRKCDEDFYWMSEEAFIKVYDFILSFAVIIDPYFSLVNLDEEFGDTYRLDYGVTTGHFDKAVWKGNLAKITSYDRLTKTVSITDPVTGEQIDQIPIQDLEFRYDIQGY